MSSSQSLNAPLTGLTSDPGPKLDADSAQQLHAYLTKQREKWVNRRDPACEEANRSMAMTTRTPEPVYDISADTGLAEASASASNFGGGSVQYPMGNFNPTDQTRYYNPPDLIGQSTLESINPSGNSADPGSNPNLLIDPALLNLNPILSHDNPYVPSSNRDLAYTAQPNIGPTHTQQVRPTIYFHSGSALDNPPPYVSADPNVQVIYPIGYDITIPARYPDVDTATNPNSEEVRSTLHRRRYRGVSFQDGMMVEEYLMYPQCQGGSD